MLDIMKEAKCLYDPRFDSQQCGAQARSAALRHEGLTCVACLYHSAPRLQQLENNERLIAERNKAVEQIMTSVQELQDIFKEIHVLVIDQGKRDAVPVPRA